MATEPTVMDGAELASALAEADISVSDFSSLTGEPSFVVMKMMMGAVPVSQTVSLFATLLTLPGAVELAWLHFGEPDEPLAAPSPKRSGPDFVEVDRAMFDAPFGIGQK